ncbi:MAG TPA: sugar ABC transporter substrate-binding protein [Defluviitoga sp.]|nr:sugar ABC transporter substrate-binding protein [Defluviitoga sp.]HPU59973.1 sugar ABC transporter substrate-binding protein [Defluviitoga tunisiensis]HPZ29617.1 sugar ABC transporter substrate-binding protein [Defluviitoga sp.]HQD63349.1 sugar ABC transporter substrate-binding protein [Defluviitoga sp.]
MKKTLFLTLILVLTFCLSMGAVTLKMLVRPDEGGVIELYTKEFEKLTGVKVVVDYIGWDQISIKTTTALMHKGGGYDIIFIPSAEKSRFAAMGQFVDLNEWFTEDEKNEFLKSFVDYYSHEGQWIGVPWYSGGAHFVYNEKYFQDANVNPEDLSTWQDVLNASKAIVEKSNAEYAFTPSCKYPGNYYYNYGTILLAMGGQFFDENLNPVFNTGIGVEALELLVEGVNQGVFNPAGVSLDDYETLKIFQAGKSAFMINSTWSANQAMLPEASTVADYAKVRMIPGGKNSETGGLIYGGAFGITKASQYKEEAVELVKLLTGTEAQMMHAISGFNLPTRNSLFEGSRLEAINKAWPVYGELVAQVEVGSFGPDVVWLDPFRRALATAVQDAISGKKTAKEALDWAARQAIDIKSQYE